MDNKVISFYREIFGDLTLDQSENAQLIEFLKELNPPPDKLIWLRATAFKIGCEFLSEEDRESNVSLLRTINAIVHAIETACLEPSKTLDDLAEYKEDAIRDFYKQLYSDRVVDNEENQELFDFFQQTAPPPPTHLVATRALAFSTASELLADGGEDSKDANTQLLRCVNCVVHAFEKCCLVPKQFTLQLKPAVTNNLQGMSLQEAVQNLWTLDVNRLNPGEDYDLNVQGSKKPYEKDDVASEPLFARVDKRIFQQRPTYKGFVALLDNYISETGTEETFSNSERQEIQTFLTAIIETQPMQFCHQYCRAHDKSNSIPSDKAGFMKLLHSIWFDLYKRSRGGRMDSSGFEHVFVGEVKNGQISGFHNWIQLALEEEKGDLDFRGYIKPKGSRTEADENDYLLSIQFRWKGVEKFVGTSFIGTSPEFEMALYTMCFLIGEEENDMELDTGSDTFALKIKCYKFSGDKIGTTFPEVTSHFSE